MAVIYTLFSFLLSGIEYWGFKNNFKNSKTLILLILITIVVNPSKSRNSNWILGKKQCLPCQWHSEFEQIRDIWNRASLDVVGLQSEAANWDGRPSGLASRWGRVGRMEGGGGGDGAWWRSHSMPVWPHCKWIARPPSQPSTHGAVNIR